MRKDRVQSWEEIRETPEEELALTSTRFDPVDFSTLPCHMPFTLHSLCIFCGAHDGPDPAFIAVARALGRKLAEEKIRLVYGGGSLGMMGAVADACLEKDGEVIGVIPELLMNRELGHRGIARLELVPDMATRKQKMADLSDAFIALPGGFGTLDEIFEMIAWNRLHIQAKPIGLLNVNGFYDDLISFCRRLQLEGNYGRPVDGACPDFLVSDSIPDLLDQLERTASTDSRQHTHPS